MEAITADDLHDAGTTTEALGEAVTRLCDEVERLEAEITRLREALVEERARGTYYADCYLDGRHNEPAYGLLPESERATICEGAREALRLDGLLP